jgi:spore germination cell wall hydrolase CwlJ-like protein
MKLSTGAGGFAAAMLVLLFGNPTVSRAGQIDPIAATVPAPIEPAPSAMAGPGAAQAVPQPSAQPAPLQSTVESVAPSAEDAARKAEEECLATAVYFEAKGEPRRGQLAVAQVILNRMHSGRFPATACGVVRQRGQFSFVHGGRLPAAPRGSAAWRTALSIARKELDGKAERVAANALFFHARGVSAGWHAVRVAQIGNQVFYR